MQTSLTVFQNHLIDYAGLFPPANLSLEAAIHNYADYKNSKNAWMLGPFVLPASQLKQLHVHIHLFSDENPLTLSVVGGKSNTEADYTIQLQNDLNQISAAIEQYQTRIKIEMLEIPLPPNVPSLGLLGEISNIADEFNVHAFCEVPLIGDWEKHVTDTLSAIAAHNSSNQAWIGVKLRTGGIKAEMFPSPEQVAFVMASCRDRNLPLKFTAGLHHPVRMYREEVGTKMHGFLNIFVAGMLAHTQDLNDEEIKEILADENPNSFSFSKDHLAWRNISLPLKEIQQLRSQSLLSFGSCSFDEPRDELKELINQQGVIL